jgi:hypothetical protein
LTATAGHRTEEKKMGKKGQGKITLGMVSLLQNPQQTTNRGQLSYQRFSFAGSVFWVE